MQPFLRPVSIGLVLGLLSLFFGVVWAINLTVNHDKIHQRLSESAMSAIEGKFVINPASGHDSHASNDRTAQSHADSPATTHDHSSHDHGGSSMHERPEPAGSASTEGAAGHLGRHLGRERGGLARALETLAAAGRPGQRAALDVAEIQIWTDVDGMLTADPRVVHDAQPVVVILWPAQRCIELADLLD